MNEQDDLDKLGYTTELSSFEWMPHKFLGIDTSLFGSSDKRLFHKHPFLQLEEASTNVAHPIEDRMQCVRYMCKIPYKNHIDHCINSTNFIVLEHYDPYKLFHFYANNDKYLKLDDHVVYQVHPTFFKKCQLLYLPLELTLLVCRAIFTTYPFDSEERTDVLEYILNIADDESETIYARAECADMLFTFGEGDEIFFGKKIINQLGDLYEENKLKTIWTNSQNVHVESIAESTMKIVRTLFREWTRGTRSLSQEYNLDQILEQLISTQDDQTVEKIRKTMYRLSVDNSKYENLTLKDIFVMIWDRVKDNQEQQKRLVEEIVDADGTCASGYLTRLVNVLSGFEYEEELVMRLSPQEELRSSVFARINAKIRALPDMLRNDLLESLVEDDWMFEEFMELHNPREELEKEYKDLLSQEEFESIYTQSVREFKAFCV